MHGCTSIAAAASMQACCLAMCCCSCCSAAASIWTEAIALRARQDLRFRSTKKPLAFAGSHGSPGRHGHSAAAALGAPLLPPHLLKLRLEGCHLTEVGVSEVCT